MAYTSGDLTLGAAHLKDHQGRPEGRAGTPTRTPTAEEKLSDVMQETML